MKIGEFLKRLETTKDTVRHYEELQLITPTWINNHKEYGEKEVENFHVVKELKDYGLSLKDIQTLFDLKKAYQCGDKQFISEVLDQLSVHLNTLRQEEEEVRKRRLTLENEMKGIRELL